jgi:hypothetical protein
MDLQTIADQARTLTLADFIDRYRGFFLARTEQPIDVDSGVFTEVRDYEHHHSSRPTDWVIVRVAKAITNPDGSAITIGRDRNCDLVLRDETVSSVHAHLLPNEQEGVADLIDQRSKNGTMANGKQLPPERPERIKSGAILRFGHVSCVFLDAKGLYQLAVKFGA